MNNKKLIHLVHGAMIGAIYAAATYLSSVLGIAYGPIQLRFSEALTVISVFTPAAIPGLTVGCILGNLASPFGIWDIILGSLATLLAASSARALRKMTFKGFPMLSLLMPVIFNALIIGAEIVFLIPNGTASMAAFAVNALEIGVSELAVCLAGGIPLYYSLNKSKIFK